MRSSLNAGGRRDFFRRIAKPESTAPMTMRKDARGSDVSLLGFGMMRLPTVDGRHANSYGGGSKAAIDRDEVYAQIDYAIAHGVNYFDTSPAYCRGESEKMTGDALARHSRERYKIATKLSNFAPSQYPIEKCREMFGNSLRFLRTDFIDYYLLHAVGMGGISTFKKRYVKNGAIEFCLRERDAGRIRNLGFSFHGDKRAWEWLMERHDRYHWDFVQIQLNYVDWRHAYETNKRNQDAEFLYAECAKRNIPVVVMEPLLGGRLAKFNYSLAEKLVPLDPEASLAKWALRFAGHFPKVMTVLSGMSDEEFLKLFKK
jgi:predicted aldo/keto reductase-like oxidoreductase